MSRDYTSTELGATLLYIIALVSLVIRIYTDCYYEIFGYNERICYVKKSPIANYSYVIDIEHLTEQDYQLTSLK